MINPSCCNPKTPGRSKVIIWQFLSYDFVRVSVKIELREAISEASILQMA